MQINSKIALVVANATAFVSVGVPYWGIPYAKASLPDSLYGIGLSMVFAASLVLCFTGKASFVRSFLVVGFAVPAVALARVIVEGFKDPTSHNLWPLELVIALAVGILVAFPGALLGFALSKLFRARVA
jgi:prolipoprotein diacylglyceryltransferase